MMFFELLLNNASDGASLDKYIQNNYAQIVAFFSTDISNQRIELESFEQFVLFKSNIIENLDFTKSYNRAFVYYLMDYCERFCSTSTIVQLYRIIGDNNLNIGSRLDAAMLYLYNVSSNQTFVDRFDGICNRLQTAINEEDDDDKKSIASFLNYYSYVVYNTSEQFSNEILSKYRYAVDNNTFPFLTNDVVRECFAFDIHDAEKLYKTVQNKIDGLLERGKAIDLPVTKPDYLIETDTDYAEVLNKTQRRFKDIRNISVQKINQFENKDDIFYSLGRGAKILKEEAQLYSYINSYGNMHEAKMLSALQQLPLDELNGKNIEIIDWACGQGLASIIFIEFVENQNVNITIRNIVLIEPSEIALKRAVLNVRHFDGQCQVKTVLKDIDSIANEDLNCDSNAIKIHLFSNILDIEGFSMEHLISIIEQTQKGVNYFVCVSPYITDAKTARIDSFGQHFANQYNTFQTYLEIENRRGEWKNGWTRVIRLFRVNL